MRLTGHKTDSVFRRYDIVSPNDLRVAVERLDDTMPVISQGEVSPTSQPATGASGCGFSAGASPEWVSSSLLQKRLPLFVVADADDTD
jgi:hypothetical protein